MKKLVLTSQTMCSASEGGVSACSFFFLREKNRLMVKESKIIIVMVMITMITMIMMIIMIIMIIMIVMIIHLQIGHLVISSGQTYGATEAGASQNLRENHDQAGGDLVVI